MNKVRLTPAAAQDLAQIKGYISSQLGNPTAAAGVVRDILRELRVLERYAQAGPSVAAKTGRETDLRMLVCGQHVALYRIEGHTISVARIINARQDYMRVLFEAES